MDRFEYVMVLISIIIGLSIAHILLGIGGLIDRKSDGRPIKLRIAHGFWLAYVFVWTVQFWWWEYRFSEIVTDWTLSLYFFLVTYAMSLFLLAVILVPRSWDRVTDMDEFFLRRRIWFYWLLIWGTFLDVLDAVLKGGADYIIRDLGLSVWILWSVTLLACIVGLLSRRLRLHEIGAVAVFVAQIVQHIDDHAALGI